MNGMKHVILSGGGRGSIANSVVEAPRSLAQNRAPLELFQPGIAQHAYTQESVASLARLSFASSAFAFVSRNSAQKVHP